MSSNWDFLVSFAEKADLSRIIPRNLVILLFVISAYPKWHLIYNKYDEDKINDETAKKLTKASFEFRNFKNWCGCIRLLVKDIKVGKFAGILNMMRPPLSSEDDWKNAPIYIMLLYSILYLPEPQNDEFQDNLEKTKPFTHWETPKRLEEFKKEKKSISNSFIEILVKREIYIKQNHK